MGFGFVGLRRPQRLMTHDHVLGHENHGMMTVIAKADE
jgi:FtsP/CotA-like multicopper oxidase with cupredoxin domain